MADPNSSSTPPPPRPVVICGPSGVGKGTLIELLREHFPSDKFGFSVSHTTRKPRDGEVDGVHYHFATVDDMKEGIEAGKFVEHAEVHGNYYGTSVESVESVQNQNLICLLDIDVQGARNVKGSALDARYLFVAPPSMEDLEGRLRGRGTESEESVLRRLANARGEMEYGTGEGNFDAVLVNDVLEETLGEMVAKFEGWFPDLLGGGDDGAGAEGKNGEENGETNGEKNGDREVADPLSFPRTDEGLAALLAEIDRDCPLEGYVQRDLTYHASNLHVAAGRKLEIALPPVEQDGSKIDWSVTVVDEYEERLDVEFGLYVIVDGEEVVAREMGRILSPFAGGDGGGKDDATEGSDEDGGPGVSAKGKFTVANSAPVTMVIKLDNSYSWIKPKKINYSFSITTPVDENMVQRGLRARSVLPKILEGREALTAEKERETERKEALGRIRIEMEEKMGALDGRIDGGRRSVEALQKRAGEAEEEAKTKADEIKQALSMVKKEERSIEECTSCIVTLEKECARLKQKWEELKVEREVRQEEKTEKEAEAERKKEERIRLQEEIAAKKAEEQSALKDVEDVEKERGLLQDSLIDLGREKKEKEAEEEKYTAQLNFLQKQSEAVKLRFIETKSS